ncbi:MAG: serine/threonine protein kinase, partial [Cyanobacteria bacterium 0813]|nr:serine/threonine protein kinase [Cyanobacteria bacterium 0813]
MLDSGKILQERYQLQQRLGRTAAGHQTWLAVDLESQEQVTLKMLAFSPEMQWEELKLFEREAQVLQALNHPRIPCYRDYFSLEREAGAGLPWFGLVQDYIPGFSLQELLEKGEGFSEKKVRKIATEVLAILIYLHELMPPVLHRDIKPSNLIWGEHQHVYLVDFGAVQAQAAVTGVTFTVVGTSGYAPLEQFWGRAVAASDLYALGATLIHLLTGVTPADLPQKDSRIQFSDRVSVNPSLVSWIEKMTEIALEKRFSKAREALAALKSGKIQGANLQIPTVWKIAKPPHCRIQVSKSATELNIKIPSTLARKPFLGAFIGILTILLSWPIVLAYLQVNLSMGLGFFLLIASILVKILGNGN